VFVELAGFVKGPAQLVEPRPMAEALLVSRELPHSAGTGVFLGAHQRRTHAIQLWNSTTFNLQLEHREYHENIHHRRSQQQNSQALHSLLVINHRPQKCHQ
jgi:hypothetical protein